ncbi:MAG TPA: hypothetical protein VH436_27320 [Vicinamibacterales bacterium]|jgi:hypothetical protein
MFRRALFGAALLALLAAWSALHAQGGSAFMGSVDDPAINYSTARLNNIVEDANRKLEQGTARLTFDGRGGFLQSALDLLQIPADSQLLVFSRASLQGKQIDEKSPRALYFNDRVAVGWVRDAPLLEIAAHDESAGVAFYTIEQHQGGPAPRFTRAFQCLGCHRAGDTFGVPGFLMFSTTRPTTLQSSGVPRPIDHTDPLSRRFGGWFVTGSTGSVAHMGNEAAAVDGRPSRELASVKGLFDPDGYSASTSDIVAHLVFTHQARMTNLLTRANWEARVAASDDEARVAAIMKGIAHEVVDYLLFVDEAALTDRVRGNAGFAERFARNGPRDRQGRSLYELDLNRRLMKYPCSFLIYSPAFDALPPRAKDPIYRRLWQVLSGEERDDRYRTALSRADRQAIVEILRDTKKDLPSYFTRVP